MLKRDLIDFFRIHTRVKLDDGSYVFVERACPHPVRAVATALNITPASVSGWAEVVPIIRAIQLEKMTGRRLQVDTALYPSESQQANQA